MIVRQQLLDRLDVVTGQQVVQCVLRTGVQVKRQTVIPYRRTGAFAALAVGPDNEHRAFHGRTVAALERIILGGNGRSLEEERADFAVDGVLHLFVAQTADLRKIDIPAMLRAVLLIAHELFVMHGLCSDAAAKVERLRLLEQRFAAAQINILAGVVLRDADHVFGQNGRVFRLFNGCCKAAVLAEENQCAVCGVVPRQTVAQLGEAADVAQRAVRQAAARIHRGNRTVLAAGRVQPLAHVGQIVIRRRRQQLAGGIHNAPAVDLTNHCFAVVKLRNGVVQKLCQQFALRERIQCLIGAVGDDHRALAVNRHVGRRYVIRQSVQHCALGVDRLIIAVLRLHKRSAV